MINKIEVLNYIPNKDRVGIPGSEEHPFKAKKIRYYTEPNRYGEIYRFIQYKLYDFDLSFYFDCYSYDLILRDDSDVIYTCRYYEFTDEGDYDQNGQFERDITIILENPPIDNIKYMYFKRRVEKQEPKKSFFQKLKSLF